MTRNVRSLSGGARLAYGLGCIVLGRYALSLGLGYRGIGKGELTSPSWVIVRIGFVFISAGFMILLAHHSRANDLLAGLLPFSVR